MKLYTPDGWLDAPHIEAVADRNNIAFIVIIGKRQIGKTYNVLKLMLDEDKRFMLLRGMKTEMDMLKKNVNSPFEKIKEYKNKVTFQSETEYTASIIRHDIRSNGESTEDVQTPIGILAALSSIGRIRGFNGDIYTDVVYDEFIPESHLLKVRNGDDAFLNMYTTIAGNRELEGRKPLRVWLLANSNNLDNDILKALKITDVVERMSLRGEESRILKNRGIMVILPDSEQITEKRKKTALYKAVGDDSKFSQMAYENKFAYNDYSDVGQKPLQEYKALISIGDEIIIHLHKANKTLYVTPYYRIATKHTFTDSDYARNKFIRQFSELRAAFLNGRMTFTSMSVKNYFLDYIDML